MNILVDGYNIGLSSGTGVATYGRGFIQSARAMGHRVELLYGLDNLTAGDNRAHPTGAGIRRSARKLIDFVQAPLGLSITQIEPEHVDPNLSVPSVDMLWNRARLFRAAKGAYRRTGLFTAVEAPHIDIAHWTYPLPIYVKGAKNIYTIHDIVPIKHPELVRNASEFHRLCRDIGKRADHILTVSETSRSDIIHYLRFSSDIVTNTYQIVPHDDEDDSDNQRTLDEHRLTHGKYFLFFGAIEPKKNLFRLLQAYHDADISTPLVVVGRPAWQCEQDIAMLKMLTDHPEKHVIWLNYLPRTDLINLVRSARAVLFPSLYEGFGLPALEAMALGTPVLTADAGALREVVDDAALLVDPLSVTSIGDGLKQLDRDGALRKSLSAKGRIRADFFSQVQYERRLGTLLR
ncbi:glycosyltransferase family 1 protein [Sphingobium sp. CR2-8]|uniref:glycosyltransferase family 1 protein n=1 Tax=Sphingobium sp. CR2-8 TaxID=1306534 RepID=UPI002DBDD393|nr:glycosyltransferase family 1 protein [Sphingobium sp. CR2-8]MEC3912789.1 glycosyltransferase family 1 protein [Sphingobium sp. CR2-8]